MVYFTAFCAFGNVKQDKNMKTSKNIVRIIVLILIYIFLLFRVAWAKNSWAKGNPQRMLAPQILINNIDFRNVMHKSLTTQETDLKQYFEHRFGAGKFITTFLFPEETEPIVPQQTPLWWRWWGQNNQASHDTHKQFIDSLPVGFIARGLRQPNKGDFDYMLREIFRNAYCAIAARYFPEALDALAPDYRGMIEIALKTKDDIKAFGSVYRGLEVTVRDNGAGIRTAEIFNRNKKNIFFLPNGAGKGIEDIWLILSRFGGTFTLTLAESDLEKTTATVTIPLKSLSFTNSNRRPPFYSDALIDQAV